MQLRRAIYGYYTKDEAESKEGGTIRIPHTTNDVENE
jgi:hypothetical protein